jgi:O-acetyl-ADP-ribose deacetylase (regulator of RNase III)
MTKFEVVYGFITRLTVDAIVNNANEKLASGYGVNGEIFHEAGQGLLDEISQEFPAGCALGEVAVTSAYELKAKHIIHAVAEHPYLSLPDGHDHLRETYREVFRRAREYDVKSIAIPTLGAGFDRILNEEDVALAKDGILQGLREHPNIEKVILSCFTMEAAALYKQMFATEIEYGLDFRPRCPKCEKPALQITYGMPSGDDWDDPNIYSGGCIIGFGQPNWACPDCEIEFA